MFKQMIVIAFINYNHIELHTLTSSAINNINCFLQSFLITPLISNHGVV